MNKGQQSLFERQLKSFYLNLSRIVDVGSNIQTTIDDFVKLLKNIKVNTKPFSDLIQVPEGSPYDIIRVNIADFFKSVTDKEDMLTIAATYFATLPTTSTTPVNAMLTAKIAQSLSGDALLMAGLSIDASARGASADTSVAVVGRSAAAASASHDDDIVESSDEVTRWLKSVLDTLKTNDGDRIGISRSGNTARVSVQGLLPIHYGALAFLKLLAPAGQANVVLDNPEMTQSTFQVDMIKAQAAMQDQGILRNVRLWLDTQGYTVATGSKRCNELFVNTDAIIQKNERAAREKLTISLAVAAKLVSFGDSPVAFPSTIQITAAGVQREQMKSYYKDAGVMGDDSKPKGFIKDAHGAETNKTNLSLHQAKILWVYFQRLDMLARREKLPCGKLTDEAIVTQSQEKIRGNSFAAMQKMLGDFNYQRADRANSYLAIEDVTRAGFAAAPSRMFAQPSGAAAVSNPMDENTYERRVEELVNSNLALGPEAFRVLLGMEKDMSSSLQAIRSHANNGSRTEEGASRSRGAAAQSAIAGSGDSSKLVVYHQEFSLAYPRAERSDSCQAPVAEYYLTLAEEIAPELFITSPNPREHAARMEKLRRIAMTDIRGRTSEMEAFFAKHSPYYFVNAMANKLTDLLDSGDVTDASITTLLTEFGVSPEHLERYKVAEMSNYNRYQIKFDAIPLALTACLNRGVLLNFAQLNSSGHAWIHNPLVRSSAKSASQVWVALEWSLNKLFNLNWGTKTDTTQYETHSSQSSKRIVDTAGSGSSSRMFQQQQYQGGSTSLQNSSTSSYEKE